MKANPFNELEKSEKIRKPESMRSYMTIEEVQALIDTPMPHEEYLPDTVRNVPVLPGYQFGRTLEHRDLRTE